MFVVATNLFLGEICAMMRVMCGDVRNEMKREMLPPATYFQSSVQKRLGGTGTTSILERRLDREIRATLPRDGK